MTCILHYRDDRCVSASYNVFRNEKEIFTKTKGEKMKILTKSIIAAIVCFSTIQTGVFSADKEQQKKKMFDIFKLECKGDINALQKYREDEDVIIKDFASKALAVLISHSIDKKNNQYLINIYNSEKDRRIKDAARASLVKIGERSVFLEELQSKDLKTKTSAALCLLGIGTDEAKREIIKLLLDSDIEKRFKEAIAIEAGKQGIYQALPIIIELYKKTTKKQEAVESLAKLAGNGDAKATEELRRIYNEGNIEYKKIVCNAAIKLAKEYKPKTGYLDYDQKKVKWQWLGEDLLKDILLELKKEKLNFYNLEILYVAISDIEDSNYCMQAYNMSKQFPELIKKIGEWKHSTFSGIYGTMNKVDIIELKSSMDYLNNIDLSKLNNIMIDNMQFLNLSSVILVLLEEKNSKLKEETENLLYRILEQPWALNVRSQNNFSGSISSKTEPRDPFADQKILNYSHIPYEIREMLIKLGNEKAIRGIFAKVNSENAGEREDGYSKLYGYYSYLKNADKKQKVLDIWLNALDKESDEVVMTIMNLLFRDHQNTEKIKVKLKNMVLNSKDIKIRNKAIKMLISNFSADKEVTELFYKLLKESDPEIQNIALNELIRYLPDNSDLKGLINEFSSLNESTKEKLLKEIINDLIDDRLNIIANMDNGDNLSKISLYTDSSIEKALNSKDNYESALALIIGMIVSNPLHGAINEDIYEARALFKDKVMGKMLEILDNSMENNILRRSALAVFCYQNHRLYYLDWIGSKQELREMLEEFIAEQYERAKTDFDKYLILTGMWGSPKTNSTIKAMWEKAGKDSNRDISEFARDFLDNPPHPPKRFKIED